MVIEENQVAYKDLSLISFIKIWRFRWFGHFLRMDEDCRIARKIYKGIPGGVRPKHQWKDSVLDDLRYLNMSTTVL